MVWLQGLALRLVQWVLEKTFVALADWWNDFQSKRKRDATVAAARAKVDQAQTDEEKERAHAELESALNARRG